MSGEKRTGTREALNVPESWEGVMESSHDIRLFSHGRGNPDTEASWTLNEGGNRNRKMKQVGEPTKRRETEDSQGVRSAHSTQRAGEPFHGGKGLTGIRSQ